MSGERRLWVKVLLMAVSDATYQGKGKDLLREKGFADRWFRHGGKDFAKVCDLAGLDPMAVREAYVEGRIDGSQLSERRQGHRAD